MPECGGEMEMVGSDDTGSIRVDPCLDCHRLYFDDGHRVEFTVSLPVSGVLI